jgi:RNA 3'-terminal phosphate cyclase (ATP)
MGPRVTAVLEKPGFYPAGGGRFRVTVQPAARLTPLELTARGDVIRQTARAAVSNLPEKIARRELAVVARQTGWAPEALTAEVVGNAHGPGNILTLAVESRHVTEVFTGFGERGVSAEKVAAGAVRRLREYLAAEVPVGRYLADQLLLPMAMSGAGRFLTLAPSRHTTTNIDIIRRFLDVEITLSQPRHDQWMVEIQTPNHRRKEPCHGVDKKNG